MTTAQLLFAITAVLLMAGLHSFVTYPLSLLLLARLRRRGTAQLSAAAESQTFTLCMCAYNEGHVIRQKMENLLALRAREPTLEILIYVDAATDDTARIIQECAPDIEVHIARERHGKTWGMNLLASRARGSILLFTDANVMLDLDCIDRLKDAFAAADVGCVCGNLSYINGDESVTAATGSLYWRFEEYLKSLEERTGSVMGADGSLFAIRRSLHHAPPPHIIDDMYVSFMVLLAGFRIVQSQDVKAYELSSSCSHEEFRRKSRIACQAFNVHRLIWPRLRRAGALTVYKYVSHKLLRWLSIYFLAVAAITFTAAMFVSGWVGTATFLLLGGGIALVLGHRWQIQPFAQVADVLLSLAGAGVGVWKSLRGESYQTWTPAASVRRVVE
jgi:cellulose synthase/poly-beta-1,6-N-acetylglucosamine synthase-like glycosyltransferase